MKFAPFRSALTLFMVWVLVITMTAFACSKSRLVSVAQDAFIAVKAAQPHIARLLPAKAEKWALLVVNAERLVSAVAASNKENAVEILAEITPVINEVVAALGANQQILTILAVADIAYHFLVNQIQVSARFVAGNPRLSSAMNYKFQRVWGCDHRSDYRPELKVCK